MIIITWFSGVRNSRSILWDLLEKPWTSLAAQYYAMASLFVVFISTLTFVASTVEDSKVGQDGEEPNSVLLLVIEITGERLRLRWLDLSIRPRHPLCCHLHRGVHSQVPLLSSKEAVRPPANEPQ